MAYNASPSTWFNGYTANVASSSITFQTATGASPSFPQLSNDEANPISGEYRKMLFAIMEELFLKWSSKAPADRPSKVNIIRNSQVNANNTITHNYSVAIEVSASGFEVSPEPTP